MNAHPMTAGKTRSSIVFLRPTLSTIKPTMGAEAKAPTAMMEPIHDKSSVVTGNPYSPSLRGLSTGDVQAKQLPLMKPPNVAVN